MELFQGAVPNTGGIIIATTNHYDKIKDALPALFRPGRLTPVLFDNLNWETLQSLTQFYFQTQLTCKPVDRVAVSTSQIVELAVKCQIDPAKGFATFERKLNAILEEQRH